MAASLRTRLYVTESLAEGQSVSLTVPQVHYLRNVLRLEAGVEVALFNGSDGEWLSRISELHKERGSVVPEKRMRPQTPCPDVWLLFAPLKRDGIDLVGEKASELGASLIWPTLTRHTDVSRVNLDRLTANAIEAAEQSERLCVPEVREPMDLPKVLANWPANRTLIVCAETGPSRPLADVIRDTPKGPIAFLIGPEGGFARSELEALTQLPFVKAAHLGPRVLRAETATFAALAVWQALKGDWV